MYPTKFLAASALGAAFALLLPTQSFAQDSEDPFGAPVPAPTPAPQPAPQPAPVYVPPAPPAAPVANTQAAAAPAAPVQAVSKTPRPQGMSVGLGFGWALPADLDRLAQASVRLRLESGLTFEPIVRLETLGQSLADGDVKNAQNQLTVGTNVRLPLLGRGKVDFVGQIGAGIGINIDDPDGGDNNTTNFQAAIDWGISAEYWWNHNWVLSLTGRNPFLSYVSQTIESPVDDSTTSTTSIGAVWQPQVEVAIHLFY